MTMQKLADDIGVSVRTLYRKAERNGISIDSLRDESGVLTSEGAQVLAALCDNVTGDVVRQDTRKTETETSVSDNVTRSDTTSELFALRVKVEMLERENALLRGMIEKAEATANDWKAQAEKAQQIQLAQMQLLPERVGFFQRIGMKFKKGKADQ